jgi:hypothetical protein
MLRVPDEHIGWLHVFFGPGNALQWQELESGNVRPHWAQHVLPWLSFLEDAEYRRPLVLPIFGVDGPTCWYGLAMTRSSLAQLTEELQAFVGRSYSDFSGLAMVLDPTNPVERALRKKFGPNAIKFSRRADIAAGALEQQVLLYAKALARRPNPSSRGRRPFGKIRADFDSALLAGNSASAHALLEELVSTGRVTGDQRKCLQIRILAGLGRFEELARDQDLLNAVVELPLPPQTLTDVISALYKAHIAPLVLANASFDEISRAFTARVGAKYGPLFRERKGLRHPDVLRSLLLFEATTVTDLNRCDSILRAYPVEAEGRKWAEGLVDWIIRGREAQETQVVFDAAQSKETQARLAVGDEDFERAAAICFELLPSLWAYRTLLRCATELAAPQLAREVISTIDAAGSPLIAQLGARDLARLDIVRKLVVASRRRPPDSGWVAWAQWIADELPTVASAQAVLKDSATKWSPEEYSLQPEWCAHLAKRINDATGDVEQIFRIAFPDIVEFFVARCTQPARAFRPIYGTLIKVLAYSGGATRDELALLLQTLRALLETAPERPVYAEAVDDTLQVFNANCSPQHVDWALDLCELLALYVAPDKEARFQLFATVGARLKSWAYRLSRSQRAIFILLAQDFECPEFVQDLPPPDQDLGKTDKDIDGDYEGTIAIYTLSERSAHFAKQTLQRLLPKAKILLNSDHVATDALKALSKNADIFVFATLKATHPAFFCVKAIRGANRMLQPQGGGAASIVRAVVDELSRDTVLA